ncbi:MAG: hypothetical protein PVS2B1_26190 [Candidatus Dormibacteraceae bacterium]
MEGNITSSRSLQEIRGGLYPSHQPSFTRLDARILQEENLFTVTVRLFDHRKQGDGAWGEEIAASIDTASLMIDALAQKYSISQEHISVSIVMERFKDGTFH